MVSEWEFMQGEECSEALREAWDVLCVVVVGTRSVLCSCYFHLQELPCPLDGTPCNVVQLPIGAGEHLPVTLGRGLESRMPPPKKTNDFVYVTAKLILSSS